MEFRYLGQNEKQNSRPLYECCFPEDTRAFVDYYYKEKCRDNQIAVACDGDQIAAMVHANPFTVSMYRQRILIHYIVAVATAPEYRRQGWMRKLLSRVLTDCYQNGEPFSFLTPADPAYYKSLGYRFWNNQVEWKLPEAGMRKLTETLSAETAAAEMQAGICEELAVFTNQLLNEHFDMYIYRNPAYYERLVKEQKSEAGNVVIVRQQAERKGERCIAGSFCYSMEDGMEVREPIFSSGIVQTVHPIMMGRIVHLERFVQSLRCPSLFSERILVRDDIIQENNGCFQIDIDTGGGTAVRLETYETAKAMDIAELGQILFDKMSIFINELV